MDRDRAVRDDGAVGLALPLADDEREPRVAAEVREAPALDGREPERGADDDEADGRACARPRAVAVATTQYVRSDEELAELGRVHRALVRPRAAQRRVGAGVARLLDRRQLVGARGAWAGRRDDVALAQHALVLVDDERRADPDVRLRGERLGGEGAEHRVDLVVRPHGPGAVAECTDPRPQFGHVALRLLRFDGIASSGQSVRMTKRG